MQILYNIFCGIIMINGIHSEFFEEYNSINDSVLSSYSFQVGASIDTKLQINMLSPFLENKFD